MKCEWLNVKYFPRVAGVALKKKQKRRRKNNEE
jgi:hypothetical protein